MAFSLFGSKKIMGLDIGTSSVKLAEVEAGRGGYTLNKFGIFPVKSGAIAGGEIVDSGIVGDAISSLVKSVKSGTKMASTGMWGTAVIVKKIAMPRMDENLVAEQIKWEAEQYIPFDINEISLEHQILRNVSSAGESMDVLLVAAKQEFVYRYLEVIESAGLKCTVVDVSGFALANCFEINYGIQPGIVAILNIGAGVSNLVILDRGEIVFCRDIPVGGQTYTSDINKSMGVSLPEAEALKISASLGQEIPQDVNTIIASTNDAVIDEIRNSFEFFSATAGGQSISKFYATGGSIYVPRLLDGISAAAGIPYEVMDPFINVNYNRKVFSEDYISQIRSISAVPIGLAIRKEGDR